MSVVVADVSDSMYESSSCVWTGCTAPRGSTDAPLCDHHVFRAWQAGQRLIKAGVYDASVAQGVRGAGFVYCIRFRDRVKIGWTSQPKTRFYSLPHDEILGVIPGTMADEQAVHRKFDHLRLQGEWFKDDPEIRRFVGRWPHQRSTRRNP